MHENQHFIVNTGVILGEHIVLFQWYSSLQFCLSIMVKVKWPYYDIQQSYCIQNALYNLLTVVSLSVLDLTPPIFLYLTRGQFHKTQTPKFVLQNAKIFLAFSLFNFIKAVMPKFPQHNAKK